MRYHHEDVAHTAFKYALLFRVITNAKDRVKDDEGLFL